MYGRKRDLRSIQKRGSAESSQVQLLLAFYSTEILWSGLGDIKSLNLQDLRLGELQRTLVLLRLVLVILVYWVVVLLLLGELRILLTASELLSWFMVSLRAYSRWNNMRNSHLISEWIIFQFFETLYNCPSFFLKVRTLELLTEFERLFNELLYLVNIRIYRYHLVQVFRYFCFFL